MNCKYHKGAEAKYICDKCKQPICEECSVDVNGSKICSSCIQKSLNSNGGQYQKGGLIESFVFFCFAVVPGAAQMYMNLFKRGFQMMFGIIASIVLFSYANTEGLIAMVVVPAWFFCFFDSYAIRRRLRRGEFVEDVTVFDYKVLIEYKKVVGAIMLVIGILGVVNSFEHWMLEGIFGGQLYWSLKRSIVPVALVMAGVFVLTRSKRIEPEIKDTEEDQDL